MKKIHNEQGSIVAMYYIIGLGTPTGLNPSGAARTGKYESWMGKNIPIPPKQKSHAKKYTNMIDAFNSFLPNSDNIYTTTKGKKGPEYVNAPWCNTWINQSIALKEYLGNDSDWLYGWFDSKGKSFKGIPSNKITHVFECIWDMMASNKYIKNEFNGQKDNWDPADTYLIKSSAATELEKYCEDLMPQFESIGDKIDLEGPQLMEKFIGSVNLELCKLVKEKRLIPISLKKQTSNVSMTVKESNINALPGGKISDVRGYFTGKPYSYFDVVSGKKGSKEIDFIGNSFFFKCHIKTGAYGNSYQIEQRMQGASPDKAEIKDIKTTDDGKLKSANAQAGQVPTKKFKDLIKKWADVTDYDYNIPKVGVPFNTTQLNYWAKEMQDMSNIKLSLNENSTTEIDLGNFQILGTSYTAQDYWDLLGKLDNAADDEGAIAAVIGEKLEKGNFSAKIRNKCYQLRFMRALSNAYDEREKGEPQLCMLLVRLYYLAAKMKMDDKDLNGPFVKIS